MKLFRRLCSLVAAATLVGQPALAQTYPERPIRLVVPYSAGSASDMLARTVAEPLAKALGQPIVIENKPGGNSTLGTNLVAKAAPDGYTIGLAANSGLAASPGGLTDGVPYNPVTDLKYVSQIGSIPFVLVVNNDVPVRTVKELLAYVKANPGKLNYASGNTGGIAYMGHIKNSNALEITHIPYKSTPPAVVDLIGGQVQVMMMDAASAGPMLKAGKLRALAISSATRNPQLPEVPTFPESGLPLPPDMSGWWALIAPAGTPDAVLDRLNAEVVKVLKTPDVSTSLQNKGIVPTPSTRAQSTAFQKEQLEIWTRMVRELKLKLD